MKTSIALCVWDCIARSAYKWILHHQAERHIIMVLHGCYDAQDVFALRAVSPHVCVVHLEKRSEGMF